jgi:hypothetical protein
MFGRAWPYKAIVKDGYVPSWPQLTSEIGGAPPCYVSYFFTIQFFMSKFIYGLGQNTK